MKILNLYAGIGGNRKFWGDEHEITAVEYNQSIADAYKKFFPNDKVIVGDAHKYLLDHYKEFDFIWSSPPCPTHSKLNKATKHELIRYPDMALYQEIIFLKHFFKGKWVVENVKPYYKLLIPGKEVSRHLFWSNFDISKITIKSPADFSRADKKVMMDWLGMELKENIYLNGNHDPAQILRNCVHPKLGLHVFNMAFKTKQETLMR